MNRALRRRHRWIIPLVGLVGATVLVAALRERARVAPMNDLSALARSDGPPTEAHILDQVLSPDSLLDVAIWAKDSSRVMVGLRARDALPYPSGQVYWRPAGASADQAMLLGPLLGERWAWFALPDGPRPGSMVVIYSPGFGVAVDSGPLPPVALVGGAGQ
jgi:hypothetical protein